MLRRLTEGGLLDRVSHGHYAIRQLGVLGHDRGREDHRAGGWLQQFAERTFHRIAYRSALDEHDLISHPSRTFKWLRRRRTDSLRQLSDRPLRIVLEPEAAVRLGAERRNQIVISDIDRSLLDAQHGQSWSGNGAALAEAIVAAGSRAHQNSLQGLCESLGWASALRRLGSLAERTRCPWSCRKVAAIRPPKGDIDLEPGVQSKTAWRDAKWPRLLAANT